MISVNAFLAEFFLPLSLGANRSHDAQRGRRVVPAGWRRTRSTRTTTRAPRWMKRRRRRRPRLCGWRNPAERARGRICCHPACPCTGTRSATGSRRGPRCARGSERTSRRWARRIRSCLPAPRARARPPSSRCWRTGCDAEGARILASTTVSTTTRLRTRARPPPPPPRVLFRGARRERAKTRRRPRSQKTPRRREKGSPLSCSRTRSRTPRSRRTPRTFWRRRARGLSAPSASPSASRATPPTCRSASRAFWKERRCTAASWSSWTRASPRGARRARAWAPPPSPASTRGRTRRRPFPPRNAKRRQKSRPRRSTRRSTRTSTRTSPRPTRISWICARTSSGSRSHRRSPCVSCSRAGRKAPIFYKRRRASRATRRAPRASPWRAPSSPARPRRELCTRCPP